MVDDMLGAVAHYLDGGSLRLERLADKLPQVTADEEDGWLFSVPEDYKHAWRGLFDISPNELESISGLKKPKAVGCVAQRTAVPMPHRRLQSWTVNEDLFRVKPGAKAGEDEEPLSSFYDDAVGSSAGSIDDYQVIVRAPIAGNRFFLNPDQIYYEMTDVMRYAYQQEVVSVDNVRGCTICWARTEKHKKFYWGEPVWVTMQRALTALDKRTKKARAR